MSKRTLIGILGGTFDPVHFGHLRTALELYQQLPFKEVRFIPCREPVHKKKAQASTQHRLAMLELAIAHQPGFVIDTIELEHRQPSYSVMTLQRLREQYSQEPLAFILGLDAFRELTTWYQWQRLLQLSHLVVVTRPNASLELPQPIQELFHQHRTERVEDLTRASHGKIWFNAVTPLAISATVIRQQIAQGFSPKYLLPDAVDAYIRQQGLYLSV